MNPEIPTVPNPLSSARIVSRRTPNKTYREYGSVREDGSPVRRGDKDFVMSRSELVDFYLCPLKWVKGFRDKTNDGMEFGQIHDAANFGIDAVEIRPDKAVGAKGQEVNWTRKTASCVEWEDERTAKGILFTDQAEWNDVQAARKLICDFMPLDGSGQDFQVMLLSQYHDKETGIDLTLKHLVDWLPSDRREIWDLKSGRSADPATWGRTIFSYKYHWQGMMEVDAANLALPDADYVEFWNLIQENVSPWHVESIMLSQCWMDLARLEYASALREYCWAVASNKWRGYRSNRPFRYGSISEDPKPFQMDS